MTVRVLILYCFTNYFNYLNAQKSITYAPDSSAFTILYDKFEVKDKIIIIDLEDLWKYKLADSVGVDIRGFIHSPDNNQDFFNVRFTNKILGKKHTEKIMLNKDFTFSYIVKTRTLNQHTEIKLRKHTPKNITVIVNIDSIDVGVLHN